MVIDPEKNTKIYPALFHTYDYIETLNAMIGDATKYDSPYNGLQIQK